MGLCTVIDICLLCLEFIVYYTDYIISIVLGQGLFNLFIFLLSDWKAYKITPPLDSVNHLCKPYLSAGQYLPSSDQENPQEITCLHTNKPLCLALSRPCGQYSLYINHNLTQCSRL